MDYCLRTAVTICIGLQLLDGTYGNLHMDEATSIFKTVFPTYDKNVPPNKDYPEPIVLDLTADLVHVADLDIVNQIMTATVDLTVMWTDFRLAWNSQLLFEIGVNIDFVWIPEVNIVNAVGKSEVIENPNIILENSGLVKWFRRLQTRTFCPYDRVNKTSACELVFSTGFHREFKLTDFGNITDTTCSTSIPSTSTWDIDVSGSKLEDEQIGNQTISADPEVTCTAILKKKTGCCSAHQSASQGGDSAASQNFSSTLQISGFIIFLSTFLQCILAQIISGRN